MAAGMPSSQFRGSIEFENARTDVGRRFFRRMQDRQSIDSAMSEQLANPILLACAIDSGEARLKLADGSSGSVLT